MACSLQRFASQTETWQPIPKSLYKCVSRPHCIQNHEMYNITDKPAKWECLKCSNPLKECIICVKCDNWTYCAQCVKEIDKHKHPTIKIASNAWNCSCCTNTTTLSQRYSCGICEDADICQKCCFLPYDMTTDPSEHNKPAGTHKHTFNLVSSFKGWVCKECKKKSVDTNEDRFHCGICDDYDVCSKCYWTEKLEHDHVLKYANSISKCRQCTMALGPEDERYRCSSCCSYDLCTTCYEKRNISSNNGAKCCSIELLNAFEESAIKDPDKNPYTHSLSQIPNEILDNILVYLGERDICMYTITSIEGLYVSKQMWLLRIWKIYGSIPDDFLDIPEPLPLKYKRIKHLKELFKYKLHEPNEEDLSFWRRILSSDVIFNNAYYLQQLVRSTSKKILFTKCNRHFYLKHYRALPTLCFPKKSKFVSAVFVHREKRPQYKRLNAFGVFLPESELWSRDMATILTWERYIILIDDKGDKSRLVEMYEYNHGFFERPHFLLIGISRFDRRSPRTLPMCPPRYRRKPKEY